MSPLHVKIEYFKNISLIFVRERERERERESERKREGKSENNKVTRAAQFNSATRGRN